MSENKKIMLPPVTERTLEPQRHAKLNKQPQLKHMLVREDKEKALIGLALDKSKTYEAQQAWASIAKKFNGLGLSSISMACGGLALVVSRPVESAILLMQI